MRELHWAFSLTGRNLRPPRTARAGQRRSVRCYGSGRNALSESRGLGAGVRVNVAGKSRGKGWRRARAIISHRRLDGCEERVRKRRSHGRFPDDAKVELTPTWTALQRSISRTDRVPGEASRWRLRFTAGRASTVSYGAWTVVEAFRKNHTVGKMWRRPKFKLSQMAYQAEKTDGGSFSASRRSPRLERWTASV